MNRDRVGHLGGRPGLLLGKCGATCGSDLGEIFRLVIPITPVVSHIRGAASDPMGHKPMLDFHHIRAAEGPLEQYVPTLILR